MRSFSALQRAENSSIQRGYELHCLLYWFQCSSASRKFLNTSSPRWTRARALVSVLFSEPKIPQYSWRCDSWRCDSVSVLFSEPKIPQYRPLRCHTSTSASFSALQRAENSSMIAARLSRFTPSRFSALQRAENSSIVNIKDEVGECLNVSVLFSEPKIPQCQPRCSSWRSTRYGFSALQRAENSSIQTLAPASIHISDRDDHASSFLSLPGASP